MTSPRGPMPGSTPTDDSDLHESGNPFDTGENLYNDVAVNPSAYPTYGAIAGVTSGNPSVPGYFFNPAADPHNQYTGGAGYYRPGEAAVSREIDAGVGEAIGQTYDAQQSSDWHAPDPYTDEYQRRIRVDTAQDDQFIPIEDRK